MTHQHQPDHHQFKKKNTHSNILQLSPRGWDMGCLLSVWSIIYWSIIYANTFGMLHCMQYRDHSGHGPSQWETTLQCNIISHCLSPCPEWFLQYLVICEWPCYNETDCFCRQTWSFYLTFPSPSSYKTAEATSLWNGPSQIKLWSAPIVRQIGWYLIIAWWIVSIDLQES